MSKYKENSIDKDALIRQKLKRYLNANYKSHKSTKTLFWLIKELRFGNDIDPQKVLLSINQYKSNVEEIIENCLRIVSQMEFQQNYESMLIDVLRNEILDGINGEEVINEK